jgi:hypothetical protein
VPTYTWVSVASSADGSKLVAVAYSGQIYTAEFTPPSLTASLSGTNLTVAWPATATGFQLQQSSGLIGNGWRYTTNSVSTNNGQNQVIISPTNNQTFYRLQGQ